MGRTTNAIERLHEEFKRRIKTQTVLPSAETAAMLFWALLAAGQITMPRSTAGRPWPWRPAISRLTSPLDPLASTRRRSRHAEFRNTRVSLLLHSGSSSRARFIGRDAGQV